MQKKKQTYNWYELMSELVDIADKEFEEINNGDSQTLQTNPNNRNRLKSGNINRFN